MLAPHLDVLQKNNKDTPLDALLVKHLSFVVFQGFFWVLFVFWFFLTSKKEEMGGERRADHLICCLGYCVNILLKFLPASLRVLLYVFLHTFFMYLLKNASLSILAVS